MEVAHGFGRKLPSVGVLIAELLIRISFSLQYENVDKRNPLQSHINVTATSVHLRLKKRRTGI
jgi:hypothetical protein